MRGRPPRRPPLWRAPLAAALAAGTSAHRLRAGRRAKPSAPPGLSPVPDWYTAEGACRDAPAGWADTTGNTCHDYAVKRLCTTSGSYGEGWLWVWGNFSNFANHGYTASTACCTCGGGQRNCCPSYRALESLETAAARPIAEYAEQLSEVAERSIDEAGAAAAKNLSAVLAKETDKVSRRFAEESQEQRARVLANSRARFDNLTAYHENLSQAVVHEEKMAIYAAARGAVDYGSALINGARLMAASRRASEAMRAASAAWERTRSYARETAKIGVAAVREYYSGAKSSRPELRQWLHKANEFFAFSRMARQQAYRGQQAALVAGELAGVTRARSEATDGLVRLAQARAQQALQMTAANSGKLDTLEAMAGAAEADARRVGPSM